MTTNPIPRYDKAKMTDLPKRLARLAPLDKRAPFQSVGRCKICQGPAVQFDWVDFNKYCDVDKYYEYGTSGVFISYLRCLSCNFVFTTDMDDWTFDDFARLIYNADYIKVDEEYVKTRPEQLAAGFASRFRGCEHARILDYGSGAGVFVDRMRQSGFRHIEAYDPFSNPTRPMGTFDIITCFEVIEHSTDPVATIGDMKTLLREDGCIIFSQTVQPPDILSVRGNWWYIAPRNGHVSTYSEESLVELGRLHALVMYRGANIYGFAPQYPSSFASIALQCAGASFDSIRLLAPREVGSHAIAFPSSADVIWHPIENDGVWAFRWTGAPSIRWDGHWHAVSLLQVRVPVILGGPPEMATEYELELNWQRKPARLDRGELVAEFNVETCTSGQIILHLNRQAPTEDDEPKRVPGTRGLRILVSQTAYAAGGPDTAI